MTATRTVSAARAKTRDGLDIVYDIWGAKDRPKRITLVHSLAMERDFWSVVAERLASKAAVLTLDCRGHGQSGKPKGPYTVEQFADDIADLHDAIGWKTSAIAGASMGGCVSLAFAIRHPARTTGLGLIDTTACYGDDAPKAWAERADAAVNKGLASLIGFQLSRWFGDEFKEKNPAIVKNATDVFLRNDVPAYAETCRMLGAADMRSKLSTIEVPTRIVVGEEDYATPVKMAQELNAGIAGSTFLVIPKARHLTPLEKPDIIVDELSKLL
jgi:3-oxoadipate enol-lactonase